MDTPVEERGFSPQVYYPVAIAANLRAHGHDLGSPATTCAIARKQTRFLRDLEARGRFIEPVIEAPDLGALPAYLDESEPTQEGPDPWILEGKTSDTYEEPVVTLGFKNLDPSAPQDWYSCTGFAVSARHILTAAHCAAGQGKQLVSIESLTGGLNMQLRLKVFVHPQYDGRVQELQGELKPSFDIALVEVPVFENNGFMTKPRHRFRIHTGNTVTSTRLRIRGTGVREESNFPDEATPGAADEPKGDARIRVRSHESRYFLTKATKRARACKGDSGGPSIEHGNFGNPIVWGVFSGFQSSRRLCPERGENMYWVKTSLAKDWIEDTMKLTFGPDFECERFGKGSQGTTYRRCW